MNTVYRGGYKGQYLVRILSTGNIVIPSLLVVTNNREMVENGVNMALRIIWKLKPSVFNR
jgi:hypothetical protein